MAYNGTHCRIQYLLTKTVARMSRGEYGTEMQHLVARDPCRSRPSTTMRPWVLAKCVVRQQVVGANSFDSGGAAGIFRRCAHGSDAFAQRDRARQTCRSSLSAARSGRFGTV